MEFRRRISKFATLPVISLQRGKFSIPHKVINKKYQKLGYHSSLSPNFSCFAIDSRERERELANHIFIKLVTEFTAIEHFSKETSNIIINKTNLRII